MLGWTADGRVLAASHGGEKSRSSRVAYAVGLDGGAPQRLPYGHVSNVALAPDGAVLTATSGTVEVAWWKGYRGGTATKLWLDRRGDGEFERLFAEELAPLESPLWLDGGATLGFVSDRDGSSELWAAPLPADGLPATRRPAPPDQHRVLRPARHVGWSARRLPERWGDLVVGRRRGGGRSASISGASGGRRCPSPIDASHQLGTISPAVDGRASAVEVRGTVSWLTHRDGPVRVLASGSTVRRRLPVVAAAAGDVAWVTDAGGDDAIEVWSAGEQTTRTLAAGRARSRARTGRRPRRFAARRRQSRRPALGGEGGHG